MGLYERDYARADYRPKPETKTAKFVKQTYQLFGASLVAGAAGAYATMPYAASIASNFLLFTILEFGLLFGLIFTKNKPGINLFMLFAFTFMTGVTSVPLLYQTLSLSEGASIIGNAFLMTGVIMGAMSLMAVKSATDFTRFEKPMFIAILIIVVFSLINTFLLHNPVFNTIISAIVVLLFSFMTVIDTQNIITGRYSTPIEGAIALYLDFLNIFLSLLELFGFSKE